MMCDKIAKVKRLNDNKLKLFKVFKCGAGEGRRRKIGRIM
jgi:hypothetical protein